MNKNIKSDIEEKEIKKREAEIETNKLLIVFSMVFLGIFYILYLEKITSSPQTFLLSQNITKYVKYIITTIFLLSGIKCIIAFKTKQIPINEYFNEINIFCVSLIGFICVKVIDYLTIFNSAKIICIFLLAVGVLYFVKVTYKKEMFILTYTNLSTLYLTYIISLLNSLKTNYIIVGLSIINLGIIIYILKILEKGKLIKYIKINEKINYKWQKINILILVLISIASVFMQVIGFNYGFVLGIIYFAIIVFYNTIKIL